MCRRLRRCVDRLGPVRAPHFTGAIDEVRRWGGAEGRLHSVLIDNSFLGPQVLLDDVGGVEKVGFGVGIGCGSTKTRTLSLTCISTSTSTRHHFPRGHLEDGEGLMLIHIEGTGTSNNISTQPSRSNGRRIPWGELKVPVRRPLIQSPRSRAFVRETLREAMNETVHQPPSIRDSDEFVLDELTLLQKDSSGVSYVSTLLD